MRSFYVIVKFNFFNKDVYTLTSIENIISITKSSALAFGIINNLISFEQIKKFTEIEGKYKIQLYGKVILFF